MSERNRASDLRQRMAYEAARIMLDQGITDFERARRKAAQRTGILSKRNWPSNETIQDAVLAQGRLFHGSEQTRDLKRMRRNAMECMRTFQGFSPRLVGSGLTGAATAEHGIRIHLFAEGPEEVILALMEQHIPWEQRERHLRYSGGEQINHPVFRFVAGEMPIELVVLPPSARRNPPLDPVTERPERGMKLRDLEQLMEQDQR